MKAAKLETDREKFKRLASKRVQRALQSMKLIGNLSNKSNYDYTEADVRKILKALQDELNACRKKFEFATQRGERIKFTL